jgi:hypothetical protein
MYRQQLLLEARQALLERARYLQDRGGEGDEALVSVQGKKIDYQLQLR